MNANTIVKQLRRTILSIGLLATGAGCAVAENYTYVPLSYQCSFALDEPFQGASLGFGGKVNNSDQFIARCAYASDTMPLNTLVEGYPLAGPPAFRLISLPDAVKQAHGIAKVRFAALNDLGDAVGEFSRQDPASAGTPAFLYRAGVLTELGLPRGEFATALVAFNLGVETGQLFVIGAAIAAIGWWRSASFYRHRIVIPASLAIAVVAMYWTVQRLN